MFTGNIVSFNSLPPVLGFIGVITGIFLFVFWIKMLISAATKEKQEDRLVWVVIICVLQIIGALVYYFVMVRKKKKITKHED